MLPEAKSQRKSGWWRLTHGGLGKPVLLVVALGIGLILALVYSNRGLLAADPNTFLIEHYKPLTYVRYRSIATDQDRLQVNPELAGKPETLTSANEVPPWVYDQLCNGELTALCSKW